MTDELVTILVGTAAILAAIVIWVGAIVYIFVDTARRRLPGWQQALWRVLAFVPLIGFLLYLFARWLAGPGRARPADIPPMPDERLTYFKPPAPGPGQSLPTIPAAEFVQAKAGREQGRTERAPVQVNGRAGSHYLCALLVLEGPHVGQEVVLNHLPACIGRDPSCQVRLDGDRGVSRRHAELYQEGHILRLRDLNSTHGTTLNGRRITDQALQPGDRIRVGYTLLVIKTGIL